MKSVIKIIVAFSPMFCFSINGLIFKENKGQWPSDVFFGTEFGNTKLYINKTGINYCIYNLSDLQKAHTSLTHHLKEINNKAIVHAHNYHVNFEGAVLNHYDTETETNESFNYYIGNNKSKWASKVKGFYKLMFSDVYAGINLSIHSTANNLFKYDFIVKPGANPEPVKLKYSFVSDIHIVNNEIIIKTSVGDVVETSPYAFQIINGDTQKIECNFVQINRNTFGFSFPKGYNKKYELVIDPVVNACSYSGTSVFAYNYACNYDVAGNIYTAGIADFGYPVTSGAFQVNYVNTADCVITAYNATGTSKLFSTYLGGDSLDYPIDLNIVNNQIYIYGSTYSPNFPFSKNAFDTIIGGVNDMFVSKLNINGSALLGSTFLGGSAIEGIGQFSLGGFPQIGGEMVCDKTGHPYLISNTNSSDFPVTSGAYSTTKQGAYDAFVTKLDSDLTKISWSSFLGGSINEDGVSIKLDNSGNVYCLGTTSSANYPTTPGVLNISKNGSGTQSDCFIAKLSPNGTTLISSTFLGTTGNDIAYLMDLDFNNNVYLFSHISLSTHLAPTAGTYFNPQGINAIYKLNSSLSTLGFKTKIGNSGVSPKFYCSAFKVDSCGQIYLAGFAYNNMPTTPNAFMPFAGGYTDMYMAVFNPNFSSLKFASYYGTNAAPPDGYLMVGEQSNGVSHFNSRGVLYLAVSASAGLPTTTGAFCASYSNTTSTNQIYNDAFLKVDFQTFVNSGSSYGANIIGCPPFAANFIGTTNLGTSYWDLGDGTTSTQTNISHTYTALGTYNILLVTTDTSTCNKTDSIKSILNVVNPTVFDLGPDVESCINQTLTLYGNVTAVSYSWSTGQNSANINVNKPGNYVLTINNGGCNSSDDINVVISEKKLSYRFPNVVTANSDNVNDFIDLGNYNFEEVQFYVYDRWGREIFKTNDPAAKWLPENLNDGTYYYVANYKSTCTGKHLSDKGFITVFK